MTSCMTGASVDTVVPEAGVCMNAPSQLFAAFTHNSANVKEHVVRQGNWVKALRGAGDVIKSYSRKMLCNSYLILHQNNNRSELGAGWLTSKQHLSYGAFRQHRDSHCCLVKAELQCSGKYHTVHPRQVMRIIWGWLKAFQMISHFGIIEKVIQPPVQHTRCSDESVDTCWNSGVSLIGQQSSCQEGCCFMDSTNRESMLLLKLLSNQLTILILITQITDLWPTLLTCGSYQYHSSM